MDNGHITVKPPRNYGVDLLRIVSMIMIPILHILGHGGILTNAASMSLHQGTAWMLEALCLCAVNCYALISGYVGYGKKLNYSNILYLYLQVVFYGLTITAVFKITDPSSIGTRSFLECFLPILTGKYWYYRAYFCLFFFIPALNTIIEKNNKRNIQKLLLALVVFFSIIPTMVKDVFEGVNNGYGFLWLMVMYLFGAYVRKYEITLCRRNWINVCVYIICAVITLASKIGFRYIASFMNDSYSFIARNISSNVNNYNSPTIVLCAVFLFLFFVNLNVGKTAAKIISFFAPLSFGVYLLHDNALFRSRLITDRFIGLLSLNPLVMIIAVIGLGIGIWLIGSLVDKVRLLLFDLLRIQKLCAFIVRKASDMLTFFGRKESRRSERRQVK